MSHFFTHVFLQYTELVRLYPNNLILIFQVREKSGDFADGQGNLERTWKFREKSGNLKINGYGRQSSENLFILFKVGNDVSLGIV